MKSAKIAILVIGSMLADAALSMSPPLIPPEPVRLEAARQMVAAMRLERLTLPSSSIGSEQDWQLDAADWLLHAHAKSDEAFRLIFLEKVKKVGWQAAPACLPTAQEKLATFYAYRMSASDIAETTAFFTTDPGRAFLLTQSQPLAVKALSDCVYAKIVEMFSGLAAEARESEATRNKVNNGLKLHSTQSRPMSR